MKNKKWIIVIYVVAVIIAFLGVVALEIGIGFADNTSIFNDLNEINRTILPIITAQLGAIAAWAFSDKNNKK